MSENIKRTIQITYDTLNDMIRDTNLKPNMVVNTLGKNSVSDGYGSTYRIYAYEGPNLTIKGPLIAGGKLVGKEIAGTNSTDDIDKLKKSISSLSADIETVRSEETQKIIAKRAVDEVTTGLIENSVVDTITALDTTGVEINLLYNGQKTIFISSEYGEEFDAPEPPEPFTTPTKVKEIIDTYLLEMEKPFTNADDVDALVKTILDNTEDNYITSEIEIRTVIENYLKEKEEESGSGSGSTETPEVPETPPEESNPDTPTTGTEGEETGDETGDNSDPITNDGETKNEDTGSTDSTINSENQDSDVSTASSESDSEISAFSETSEDDTTDSNDGEITDEPEEPDISVVNTPGISISLSEDKITATVSVNIMDFPWVLPKAFELSNDEITIYKVSEGVTCEHQSYSDLVTFTIDRRNRPEVIFYT